MGGPPMLPVAFGDQDVVPRADALGYRGGARLRLFDEVMLFERLWLRFEQERLARLMMR